MKQAVVLRAVACSVSMLALAAADPVFAQPGTTPPAETPAAAPEEQEGEIILVTAQRRAQLIQDVPISVSAFSGDQLERQQIENASDLQLSLPNVTYTKTNFTSSSFTIRGVGDLCVGFSCDTATGIHVNDMPLLNTRLFETEYFDLARLEVLRGPQGTLYGRNATSGVVNIITARPDLNEFHASAQAEYGNFDSIRLQGMINIPVGDAVGVRLAGYYLNRDGMTSNLFDGGNIDGRDLYALRATIRIEPTTSTRLDLIGYYFRENDNRSRIQKQLCNRDPTGILGCAPDSLQFETVNGNATLAAILASREFLRINNAALTNFGLGSLYGPDVFFGGANNPADLRTVNTDFNPTYFAEETHLMARLEQDFGDDLRLTVTGGYARSQVDSRTDYNLVAGASLANNPGLLTLAATAAAPGVFFPGGVNPYTPVAAAAIPNGAGGGVCTSEVNLAYTGIYGGSVNRCTAGSTDYDRSQSTSRQYAIEGHFDSSFDGPFNFLVGGIYIDQRFHDSNYYVASFGLDYAAGILGAATALGQRAAGNVAFPNVFLAPPFFNSEVNSFTLRSYGLFGEVYFDINDRVRLTGGLRYSNDRKRQVARVPILSWPVPFGVTDATTSPFIGGFDADASRAGNQLYDDSRVSFDELTGRFVGEFRITPDNMVYASYSRGYKSGGINPPVDPSFGVARTFEPEIIQAIEIGSRNTFMNGGIVLNLSAFYYDYSGLQLSRIVARTSVNDNTDAEVYGAELEALFRPTRNLLINLSASYLNSSVGDLQLADPRDVSGGRSDVVIIKDATNASNCAVVPNTAGNALGANTLVTAFNGAVGLAGPVPVPGTNTTGAYSICSALAATIANPSAPLRALFATPTGPLPFSVSTGVAVDLSGNELPQAPNWKFSAGIQHTFALGGGMTIVPRVDFSYTGGYFARSFNRPIDRIDGYEIINAQIQLNGRNDRWFVRAFVQNLTDNDAITGLYVTDQSSGLFTNAFTLDPRRYGVAAGVRF
ncbi:MAG TPA: TonB-dependent receptor [Allosphingosinicella sp.]|nr:TonB-dependent receptor [Allosphingosinicella sp.]